MSQAIHTPTTPAALLTGDELLIGLAALYRAADAASMRFCGAEKGKRGEDMMRARAKAHNELVYTFLNAICAIQASGTPGP